MTGTDIVHIPYKGGAPAIADLIAGNVQLMFESTNSIAPHVKRRPRARAGGHRRAARHQPARSADADRAGVPGYEVNAWSGLITTAGVPRPVLDNAAANRAIQQPETKERLAQLGSEGGGGAFPNNLRRSSVVIRRNGPKSCAAPAPKSTRKGVRTLFLEKGPDSYSSLRLAFFTTSRHFATSAGRTS